MTATSLLLPVFGGQGSLYFHPAQTDKQSFRLAESPSGRFLLAACYSALHTELNLLSDDELEELDLHPSDFFDKQALITPPDARYVTNPAICGPTLLLLQILRYLAFIDIEVVPSSTGPLGQVVDVFQSNIHHGVGVLGFSSGILAACVVATSSSTLVLINRAVEAYRLALWIGIRAQIYRVGVLKLARPDHNLTSWSLVLFGISKCGIQNEISIFNKHLKTDSLFITAVLDDHCVTISGHPDHLNSFKSTLPENVLVQETTLQTLYHSPVHFTGIRAQILTDISSRNILFPTFADIIVPIRSTFSGDPITKATNTGGSLAELVIDMVLTQPVNWDLVVSKTTESLPCQVPVHIVNVGPGTSLTRGLERAFTLQGIAINKCSDLNIHFSEAKQEPIAIVGMSVNMPGAPGVGRLWEILVNGSNTVQEIPKYRFDSNLYTNGVNPGRTMRAHMGNFISGVDEFDHEFFNISPREAKSMDPQQRILLQVAYEALEDSGYVPNSTRSFDTETFGCFIGAATHDYVQNLRNDIDVYYSTGTLNSFLTGRLSYCLGLSGPSLVIDTACSSSIVALHQASRALMNRDCHAALVGAVNIISSPDMFIGLDSGHFLSPSGQCKPFDASADGYCRGEGCGVFVLKRLSDAIDENDRILGVIRGVEVNQSGRAQSITHPHVPTQAALLRQLLSNSGVEANSINVVESHGTGTQAGDRNEMTSIRQVLAACRLPNNPLYVTSIKSNMGHLEAASGCASLAKVLLMFHRQVIPQQISLRTLNPEIVPLAVDNTVVTTINLPWHPVKEGKPRLALVNNFGASGSNAAVLVEEHMSTQSPLPLPDGTSYVFGLSAKNGSSLEALRSKYLMWLQDFPGQRISDVAYTMTARRQVYACRLAFTAGNSMELANGLASAPFVRVSKDPSPVVFVLTGQGTHYQGMGRSLYLTSSIFKCHIDECHKILVLSGFTGIVPLFLAKTDPREIHAGDYMCAVFSIQFALAKLWMFWGIRPVAIVGHSLGEFAGLVIAGVLNLRDALIFVASRERLMSEKCETESSGMVAVSLEPVKLQTLLESQQAFSGLSIACYNSPIDCVVSGPLPQLKILRAHLDTKAIKNSQLAVPFGYHSLAMLPILDELRVLSGKIKIQAPSLMVVSTVLGRVVMPGDISSFTNDYFVRHCAEPVLFAQGISSYVSNGNLSGGTIWIEIGPHPAILPMLQKFPDLSDSTFLGSLRKGQDSWSAMSAALCSLYLANQSLDWRRVFSQVGSTSCISLPSYPFSKKRFWVPFREETAPSIMAGTQPLKDSMIHYWIQLPCTDNGNIAIFEIPITRIERYMTGHCVADLPLCPASVYLEFVIAGVILTTKHLAKYYDGLQVTLGQIHFNKALTLNAIKEGDIVVKVVIDSESGTFRIESGSSQSERQIIHAHGKYRLQSVSEMATELKHNIKPKNAHYSESFSARTVYEVIFPRVVKYSKEFQTVQHLAINSDGMGATATITLGSVCDRGSFIIDPAFLDTLLHVAGFVSNLRGDLHDAYICDEIGFVELSIPSAIKSGATFVIHCGISWSSDKNAIFAESYAISDAQPKAVVAHMKGIRFRRLRLNYLKASLADSLAMTSSPHESLSPALGREIWSPEKKVLQIIARTCDTDLANLTLGSDLDCFGIDSLMRLELAFELARAFPTIGDIQRKVLTCNKILDIVNMISSENMGVLDNVIDEGSISTSESSTTFSSPTLSPDNWEIVCGKSQLRRIFADILEMEQNVISDDQDLTCLGLDSLTLMEAIYRIKKECNLHLSASFFEFNRTIRDIHNSMYEQHSSKPLLVSDNFNAPLPVVVEDRFPLQGKLADILNLNQNLVPLQKSLGHKIPLVLIHDGSGLTMSYRYIADLDRDVWGIHNPRFTSLDPWKSVVEMAESYAESILKTLEGGPLILGGWSFGGVVAFEVAKQLGIKSKLVKVQGIILIDSPNPLNHIPLSLPLIEDVINNSKNVNSDMKGHCKTQFTTNAKLLSGYDPYETVGEGIRLVYLACKDGYKASRSHVDVPFWLADRRDITAISKEWELVSGSDVQCLGVPGHHFEPFQPQNIAAVSIRIAEACEILEKENGQVMHV